MTELSRVSGTSDLQTGNQVIPAGVQMSFAGRSAPEGWLMCEGQAVSRSRYATLFGVIGTLYGVGDGRTTFNVPDVRGRVLVAADGGAGRLTSKGGVGESGGEQSHTLTTAEMPVHAHGVTDPGHEHALRLNSAPDANPGLDFAAGTGNALRKASDGYPLTAVTPTGVTVQNAGSGSSHNNMPPYVVVGGMIIKT